MSPFAYTIAGLFTGIVIGLTGVGGGSLMTPILVLVFGTSPAAAVGTDLIYAAATKSIGTLANGFKGAISWNITGLLGLGSVPAAALTLLLLHSTGPLNGSTAHIITVFLGYALLITVCAILAKPQLQVYATSMTDSLGRWDRAVLTIVVGAIVGVFVTLSSVGAGALGVTALVLLYPRLSMPQIVATDMAHSVPLALVAGLGHWLMGSVQWGVLGWLLLGSIPGILIGSALTPRISDVWLRRLLALVLAIVGAKLVFS